MKQIIAVALLLLALSCMGCRMVTGGNYVLRNGETLNGDLLVTGGDSRLEQGSLLNGSLIVSGGSIRADGLIEKDVSVTGGSINFGSSAVVRGVLRESGGGVRIAEGADVHRSGSAAIDTGSQPLAGIVITLIVFVVLVGLVLSFVWTARSGRLAAPAAASEPVSGATAVPAMSGRGFAGSVVGGIILIGLGVLFLLDEYLNVDVWHYAWPFLVLLAGLVCFAMMFARGRAAARLALPGSVLTMLGVIFLYQNTFDQFQTWAYAWTLIFPTAIGIGRYLDGWWSNRPDLSADGARLARLGLVMFILFAAFFELFINLSGFVRADVARFAFPLLLILVGALLILSRLFNWGPFLRGTPPPAGTSPTVTSEDDK